MTRLFLWLSLCAMFVSAQEFQKHNIVIGGGLGLPVFERSQIFWENSALLSAGYGFRFHRRFQADFGYARVFNPADKQFDALEPIIVRHELGRGRIDSYMMGGRTLFQVRKRILLSAGIGALRERFTPPEFVGSWTVEGSGWGAYVLGGASFALDARNHFRIGITPRLQMVQSRAPWLHRDRWVMLPVEVGFSF